MVTKLIQSFFIGILMLLVLDYLFFAGLYSTYFRELEIKEYFNIVFVDNQIYTLLILLALPVGYYILRSKIAQGLYILLMLLSLSTFNKYIGVEVGYLLFSDQEVLYKSREHIYIRDINSTKKLKRDSI